MGNSARSVEQNVSLYVGKQPRARERISQLLEKIQCCLLRSGPIGYGTLSKADKRLFKLILKGYKLEWPYQDVSRLLELDASFSCSLVEGSTTEQLHPSGSQASYLEERKVFVVGVITSQPRVPEVFSQTPSFVDGSLYFADGTGAIPCVVVRRSVLTCHIRQRTPMCESHPTLPPHLCNPLDLVCVHATQCLCSNHVQ